MWCFVGLGCLAWVWILFGFVGLGLFVYCVFVLLFGGFVVDWWFGVLLLRCVAGFVGFDEFAVLGLSV